ncbi:response regulator transcription factor [Raoultibacter phocaeensis]|uniref:response regulator transcription factor n=1 Tax=Raoultibacter phocaeensis TaxID=2479841 RepID=UPI0011186CDE|nr:response regulator transcription factor [Raoultibacter phocaeensis]
METAQHICVCDDEAAIADLVGKLLVDEGYRATVCYSARQVLDLLARDRFDLVILDIMMPGIDGFACCREIRKTSQVPVIFLTAKDEEIDKVVGFELGADDYVVKPFKPRELMARVKARLRRSAPDVSRKSASNILEAGGVSIDEDSYTASVLGEELSLTPKEYAILLCLAKQAGRPVASGELFETVWGEPACVQGNNTVMVHIRHLRKKIAAVDSSQEYIETVWGVGYKLG